MLGYILLHYELSFCNPHKTISGLKRARVVVQIREALQVVLNASPFNPPPSYSSSLIGSATSTAPRAVGLQKGKINQFLALPIHRVSPYGSIRIFYPPLLALRHSQHQWRDIASLISTVILFFIQF